MKINLLDILDHKVLRSKNNIVIKSLKSNKSEDSVIRTISREIVKLISQLQNVKKG